MRSSARLRAALGHGRNRDSAFGPPTLPNPSPFPSTLATSLRASTQSNPQREKSNQDFECYFTVVSFFWIPSLQEKPPAHPPQKGPPERLIRNLTLYYNPARDAVHCELFLF